MKKALFILLVLGAVFLLLAGCGRGDAPTDNQSAPVPGGSAAAASRPKSSPKAAEARLTGLYEGGSGAQKNQMCIVEKGAATQFGLIVWGGNLHSCSGAGTAVRKGETLTLSMTGDESCKIEATFKDGNVELPASLPEGCAYYCGARASFAGARLSRAGDDVKKATDIAGDPLCD